MLESFNYQPFFNLVYNFDLKQKFRSIYEWFIFNKNHVTINNDIDDNTNDNHQAESHHQWPSSITTATKQNLIEGVDDDVVVIFTLFFLLISMFAYYLFTRYVCFIRCFSFFYM